MPSVSFPPPKYLFCRKILLSFSFPHSRGDCLSPREKGLIIFYGFNISISLPSLPGTVFVMPDNTELHFMCEIWIGDWLEDFALGDACKTQWSIFFVLLNNTLLECGLPSAWELRFSCFSWPANSTEEYPSEPQLSIKKRNHWAIHMSLDKCLAIAHLQNPILQQVLTSVKGMLLPTAACPH